MIADPPSGSRDPSGPTPSDSAGLSHLDGAGKARMVDITGKVPTHRRAVARARVTVRPALMASLIPTSDVAGVEKSPALEHLAAAAAAAGRHAAKVTATLIPLCHPLTVSDLHVRVAAGEDGFDIEAEATTFGRTGVEMEALTACAYAALTLVTACGAPDQSVAVESLTLVEKRGGRSGHWVRDGATPFTETGGIGGS